MELRLSRKPLLAAIENAIAVTTRKSGTVPILGHVLITPDGARAFLDATDLEVSIRSLVPRDAEQTDVPPAFTLHAGKLAEILKATDAEEIEIKNLDNDRFEVRAGRARFKMYGLDPRSFPAVAVDEKDEASATLTLNSKTLADMIDKVIFAISPDEARYNLNGVYLVSTEGGARMVATDGHRLAMVEREARGFACPGVIIPRKGMVMIRKLIDGLDCDIELKIGKQMVRIDVNNTALSSRLVEGDYPDYQGVIPKDHKRELTVSRDAMLAAVKRTMLMSDERIRSLKVAHTDEGLAVSSVSPGLGEASEVIECAPNRGETFAIGFNGSYIAQVLAALPAETDVTLRFVDEATAAVIQSDTDLAYQYICMPCRLA